ncbi:CinA family protein [Nitratireductor basaltis]|uniref:CinA domain-containing protein n=1 Tax=Nitratireductor basaltis TaxID=472175 RepID=A0A084UAK0_9HYPH|nr:CinA family protein [Nitratireductor basaltis]KFB09986.1 CinA domain-containing protein [Nitratireductor basaltis]
MSDTEILAGKVLRTLQQRGLMLATAESCTGGLVAGAITDINGASEVLDRGFVTYTNEAKVEMLGVDPQTIKQHGAVSKECAREMADGALRNSHADIAVSITGIAGPGGGSPDKPVGLVWFGLAVAGLPVVTERRSFAPEGRAIVRRDSVLTALQMVLEAAEKAKPQTEATP